jgi:hypothetical protein
MESFKIKNAMDELASLDDYGGDIALERLQIFQPCLEQDRSLNLVTRKAETPCWAIDRWLTRHCRLGLAPLARKAREDSCKRRA